MALSYGRKPYGRRESFWKSIKYIINTFKYMKNTLIIKGEFIDLNTYVAGMNRNRFIGAKYKKEETERVWGCCKEAGLQLIKNPVFLVFEWYSPNKRKDKDNISFAKKAILDGLVLANVLKDDGWDNIIGFLDVFYVDKSTPRVEITFTEDPGEIKIKKYIELGIKNNL
jgi:Holliday junction resolvase RusA-like endonuclease